MKKVIDREKTSKALSEVKPVESTNREKPILEVIFVTLLKTHLSQKMTHRDLRNICTTRNTCKDTLPWPNMALKLPQNV